MNPNVFLVYPKPINVPNWPSNTGARSATVGLTIFQINARRKDFFIKTLLFKAQF